MSCEPEDLTLGMRTEVVFDHVEDVWLPLFKPCAEQPAEPAELPADEIPAGTHWRHVRPMVRQSKFEDKAAITGIGASAIGRRLMRPPLSLTIEARERAVADAGLTMADIDGLSTYPGGAGGVHGITEGGVAALEPALGIQPTWYSGGTDTFGPGGSVIAALVAVAAGAARAVLPHGMGVDLHRAHEGGAHTGARRWRARGELDVPVWGDLGDAHPRADGAAPLPHLRWLTRDSRVDRAEPAGQRGAQSDGDLPRAADDGGVPVGAAHYDALRAV